jgi:hypothetical protein
VKRLVTAFIALVFAVMILVSASSTIGTVKAANSQEYSIKRVDHTLNVMYDGNIFMTEKIRIEGKANDSTAVLDSFLIGFPYKYGQHLLRATAYNSSASFKVNLNVPLEDRLGFYAVEVTFPPQSLSVRNGTEHMFTVGFLLSNDLLRKQDIQNTSRYTLDFPEFPSFTKDVSFCNVSVVVPEASTHVGGSVAGFAYTRENLPAFTYSPANVAFSLIGYKISIVDVRELKREVTINEFGEIVGSDTFVMTNKGQNQLFFIELLLPMNASNVEGADQFGRRSIKAKLVDAKTSRFNVTFSAPLGLGNSTTFTLKYTLLSTVYRTTQTNTADSFNITFPIFQNLNYYVGQESTVFVLPEGARIQNFERSSNAAIYGLSRGVFQETLTVSKQDVMPLDHFNVRFQYAYNSMWLAFRPTIWMITLALIGCAVALVWRRPKETAYVPASTATARMRPEYLRGVSDAYEEKLKIVLELSSLEGKVQKGKIPRRRYKVQKKTLETRLSTLSRTLSEYKEKLRVSGGHYSELMLQLEVAESEIKEADSSLRDIEVRYNQGELSLEAYRKRQDDYRRRKENAEAAVNGILLRFREETR